ncbi:hypothetical protein Taro_009321 [Colocasia esculenta]|uniref:CCHC-type domain-containing protein n=1 Tax=Colocasia esculenta TaxID=4460 RepID=A0A843U4G1_COLES|nr:hypothetical protein [Colocasia esculenta]
MAAQGFVEGQSVNRPPFFDGEDYNYWKTMMQFFLQGYDYQLWTIIEEGDLIVLNPSEEWTDDDRRMLSRNSKAKNLICCALIRSEFIRISACKLAKEMWDKLKLTYEGTDKVKKTRIDILVTHYEKFQMLVENASFEDSNVDDVLSKLQKILKKKKNGSKRIQKKDKKEKEPVCYECRNPGHLRPNCLRLKKIGQQDKSKKKHKKYKKKAMTIAWDNEEVSSSDSSSSDSKKDKSNLSSSYPKSTSVNPKLALCHACESDDDHTHVDGNEDDIQE